MTVLHLPWLELAILLPAVGSIIVGLTKNFDEARSRSLLVSGWTLFFAIGAWQDFAFTGGHEAHDGWDLLANIFHKDVFVIDKLSAPLLPLGALLYLMTELATLRTKVGRFSFASALISEAILLATFACKSPWLLILLIALGMIPPYMELLRRRHSPRVFVFHMGFVLALLVAGQWLSARQSAYLSVFGVLLLAIATLVRDGIVPAHCWISDLFENASFGTSLLFVTPMVGTYGAMRLVIPYAPDWVLSIVSLLSVATCVYAAGMALVQKEARRFFSYIYLSNSAMVLIGLETSTPIGLTGALCGWLSCGLAICGFGLTIRAVESRTGPLSLTEFHGLYNHVSVLAAFFLITGLASVGFPGTIGFVGAELLVDGIVHARPFTGTMIVITMALNGLAILKAYFRIFTGTQHEGTIDIQTRFPERLAVLTLALLIFGGGFFPQPGVRSRYDAAMDLLAERQKTFPNAIPAPARHHHASTKH